VENGTDVLVEWKYAKNHEETKTKYINGEESWGVNVGKKGDVEWTEQWK